MLLFSLWLGLALGATPNLQEQVRLQQTVVHELDQKIGNLERDQAENSLNDLRRQVESELQALQEIDSETRALGAQMSSMPTTVSPEDVSIDLQVSQLENQIQFKQTVVRSLYQQMFSMRQTNIPSMDLDRLTGLYNQELSALLTLQGQHAMLRAQRDLNARLVQHTAKTESDMRNTELQKLVVARNERQKSYEALLKQYDEARRKADARQNEIDDLHSRYLDAKQALDALQLSASSNPSE